MDFAPRKRTLIQQLHSVGCAGGNTSESTYIRLRGAPATRLLIVTTLSGGELVSALGAKQALMGLLNKQDYARWHSYCFHVSMGYIDATIRPEGAQDVSLNGKWKFPEDVSDGARQAPMNYLVNNIARSGPSCYSPLS